MKVTDEDTYLVLLSMTKSSCQCEDYSYFRHLCTDDTVADSHNLDRNDFKIIENKSQFSKRSRENEAWSPGGKTDDHYWKEKINVSINELKYMALFWLGSFSKPVWAPQNRDPQDKTLTFTMFRMGILTGNGQWVDSSIMVQEFLLASIWCSCSTSTSSRSHSSSELILCILCWLCDVFCNGKPRVAV